MPRLNVLGTFEELEKTETYMKLKLHTKKRFHYLNITAEVINERKVGFSSISILIKNYRVHRLLAISTLITILTKFNGFRIIWVIKRHPMKKPLTLAEEWKRYRAFNEDFQASSMKIKVPKELAMNENYNETTLRDIQTDINAKLMDIIEEPIEINVNVEGKDSIYESEDEISALGTTNEERIDLDLSEDFETLSDEHIKINSPQSSDLDDVWSSAETYSSGHEDAKQSPIQHEEQYEDELISDEKATEVHEIKRKIDEDELSPRNYKLKPIQEDDFNGVEKESSSPLMNSFIPQANMDEQSNQALETFHSSSSSLLESSIMKHSGMDSSDYENQTEPWIDLYLVLDSPFPLDNEKLNKIMEQPFRQINYSVNTFDRMYYIDEVGIDENDYGLISFIR